jgi:hypothetical protein
MWKDAVMAELPWDLPGGTDQWLGSPPGPPQQETGIRYSLFDFMGVWIIVDDYGLAGRDAKVKKVVPVLN